MDNFDSFGFENDFDDAGDEQFYFNNIGSHRDSTLFLVDCSPSMFVKPETEERTLFEKCMKAVQNMYQHKIYGSDKDLLGIVFFGTKENNTGEDFPHIYSLQSLDQPSAERIKEIERFSSNFDFKYFRSEYGNSNEFSLDKVFWWCSNMFSSVTQKLDTRRIVLFTRKDQPHSENKTLEKLAKNKAKDLYDIGIVLEVVPVVLMGEEFDYSKFYADALMLSEEDIKMLPDPSENFEELEKTVRSKDHKRRPYTHLKLNLSDDLAISCSVFNLVRECPKPSKIKLDKKTNVETKTVTRRYNPDTGEILFASDTKLALDIFDRRVTFEEDEIKSIKRFGNPGLKVLGFKDLKAIKPYMYIKPGHFLYPDEKSVQGSTTLFRALLEKCLEKEKFILCEIITRVNTPPRLVALCAQKEEIENKIQTMPPGFQVLYLPFADDIRQIDRVVKAKTNPEAVDLFTKCITKLRFKYNPENFKNPALQKLWFEIEAIALAREETEKVEDLTLPDNDRVEKRAGLFLDQISREFNLPDKLASKSKRKNDDTHGILVKKTKNNENIDVAAEAKAGRLEKLTIPILKEFMKENKINAKGTRKDDLIKEIKSYLNL
ncbi:unnamed protein product [Brachionus calyciflorus]|uniref:DNA helicase n=1 Tax=Brachionus calyciflorus TaxID=104777 RepID=A0A813VM09_9BILA|nr:unnamed protein product [Brachionus calyciflorus]